jgi:hypothetical protein
MLGIFSRYSQNHEELLKKTSISMAFCGVEEDESRGVAGEIDR